MVSAAHEEGAPYYWNPREDLVPLLPPKVSRALDVGCGAGAFAGTLMRERNAEVWGLELREDVAKIASQSLHKVVVGDASEALGDLPEATFDLISFNDVLEHLMEPEKVLRAAAPLLVPGGAVLVSVPNIRYWDVFRRFVWRGEWEYEDLGVLDRTHARFFTKKSIPGFFARSGFRIQRMEGLNPTPSKTLKLVNAITLNRFADCRCLQYGMIATPFDEPTSLHPGP